jgi:deferrochelatase/peroxidase EfeB
VRPLSLDLNDIQGDVLVGLQKNAENFIFFKFVDVAVVKYLLNRNILQRVTSCEQASQREFLLQRRRNRLQRTGGSLRSLNLGFTRDGIAQLVRADRPALDPAFERGADHPDTVALLHDPPKSSWLTKFVSDRIDGVFLVTGADRSSVTSHSNELLRYLGGSIKVVYSEIGNVRPGEQRGHEHFGFLDGISQPGIRGLTPVSNPRRRPDRAAKQKRRDTASSAPVSRLVPKWSPEKQQPSTAAD